MTHDSLDKPSPRSVVKEGGEHYIHIGLHKTGSTFLQETIFPIWPGLKFCKYNLQLAPLLRALLAPKLLISNEHLWCNRLDWLDSDMRWRRMADPALVEESIRGVQRLFPEAKILVSFRHHLPWIRSMYTQYLQEGGTAEFEEFFDIQNDQGIMKRDFISFRQVLDLVEDLFPAPPLLFFQEDLRKDLPGTLERMGTYMDCPPPSAEALEKSLAATKSHNRSVGHYQANLLRFLNRMTKSDLNPRGKLPLRSQRFLIRRFRLNPRKICQWGPATWLLPNKPFQIAPEIETAINEYFQEDWESTASRIEQNKRLTANVQDDSTAD